MRRSLSAALLTLVLTAGAVGAVPAAATPVDPGSTGVRARSLPGDPAVPGPTPTADGTTDGTTDGTVGGAVGRSLLDAVGEVSAFVQLAAPSAADVADAGGDVAAVDAAAQHIQDLAVAVVPAAPATEPADEPDAAPAPDPTTEPQRLSVTTNVLAGAVVRGDAARIRDLAASPDVVAVHRIIPKRITNSATGELTGALHAWRSAGGTGDGVRVGVIDTGVDYTHATFGGPGTAQAYADAYGADGTAPLRAELHDPAKFLGGVDLAGPRYDASGTVPGTTRDPRPDANPIDPPSTGPLLGHGTHVAGIGFGLGVGPDGATFRGDYAEVDDLTGWRVGPGSAPGAGVYALKVFGDLGGTTELTVAALDWAMDPDGDRDFSDHLDVVNVSLGEDWLPADDPENLFVEQLAERGVLTVLGAGGNTGDVTDAVGAPATARSGLTVANSVGTARVHDAVEVTGAPDQGVIGPHPAQYSTLYRGSADVTAPVVHLGDDVTGCTPLSDAAGRVRGAVVWLQWDDTDPRECGSGVRFEHARAAGAVGVLVGTELPDFDIFLGGSATLPGAQLTAASTERLLPQIRAGGVTVRLAPSLRGSQYVVDESLDDTLYGDSPRGVHGSLGVVKPDVAAPGTAILSARSAGGTEARLLSGTSMAAPHVAGIAALVRAAHPSWTPAQVKAAVMNTATHDVRVGQGASSPVHGPLRAGSGRVDADAAVRASTLAYATDDPALVSVAFGVVPVGDRTVERRRTVTVHNTGDRAVEYRTSFDAATTSGGATITASPATVTVAPGARELVTLTLTADPATLAKRLDPTSSPAVQSAAEGFEVPRDFVTAVSGRLVLRAPDGDLRVPVVAAPRLVADLAAEPVAFPAAGAADAPLTLTGRGVDSGGWTSLVAPMQLVATSPALPRASAATSPSAVASGDLRAVGFASTAPQLRAAGEDVSAGLIGIGIATEGEWARLGSAVFPRVDTDVDADGTPDFHTVVSRHPAGDLTVAETFDADWVRVGLAPVNTVFGDVDTTVFDSNVVVVPIQLAALGIAPGTSVTMTVSTWSPYAADPSGRIDAVEPFTVDPYAPQYWFDGGTPQSLLFEAAPGTPVTVHRDAAPGTPAPPLLVLHTHNATPAARAQVVDVTAPAATPTAVTLTVTGSPAVGSAVTLAATVTPPTAAGAVEFVRTVPSDGPADVPSDVPGDVLATVPVQGGRASASVRLGAGDHRVVARFVPADPRWAGSQSTAVPVAVPHAASRVDVRLSDRAIAYGDLTTATVEVTADAGTPSGEVEVLVAGTVVARGPLAVVGSTGTASIDLPRDLAVGGHRVTARYTGGGDVAPASAWLRLRVTPADPDLTLTADSWTVRPGARPTVTVRVTGQDGAPAPTGRVTVLVNLRRVTSTDLGPDGTVTVTLPSVGTVGLVTALYGGDHGYRPDAEARALRVR